MPRSRFARVIAMTMATSTLLAFAAVAVAQTSPPTTPEEVENSSIEFWSEIFDVPPDHLVFDGRLHFDVDDRGDVQGYTGGTVESPEADLLGVIGYNLRLTQPLGNRTQGFCDNGIETTTHQITLVCPSDLTWMENTTDAVFVEGFIDGIYPIQTNLTGVRPGTDVYQNNETPGDVNIGINWSLDTFRQGSSYALGLTTNDGTNFQSGPFDGAIGFLSFAFDLPVSGFLIDADAIPEGLSELRFSIVDSGFNSDKLPLSIDLIDFGTLLIGDSPVATTPPPTTPAPTTTAAPTITPAPTPAEPATTPTTPFSTSPPAPPPATAAPTAGDDGGGSGGGVTIIIGGLIIAIASFGVYLYSRRRAGKDCEPEERAYALARARVMNTETKRQVADANLADARSRRGALTGQMTTPSPPHRTEFSGASDDPDFLQALEAHAAVAARSEAARAQAAAIDAEIATGEASLRDAMAEHDAAIDAENEARLALDACLAGRTDGSSSSSGGSAASVGGTTTRPGGGSGSTAGDGTETGGGTPEGGGQSGPSAPAIVDQPETTEPKECEPEGKEEVRPEPGADSVVFAISAGNVLIRISGSSTQWAEFVRANGGTIGPAGASLDPGTVAGLSKSDFLGGIEGIQKGAHRVTVTATMPITTVTIACGPVWKCVGTKWVKTDRVGQKRTEVDGTKRWTKRAEDPTYVATVLAEAAVEIEAMQKAAADNSDLDC